MFLFRIKTYYRHKSVGRGYVENVRYELLFALNNKGPSFDNEGRYIGTEDNEEVYMNEITQKIVTDFDRRIIEVEKVVNKVFSFQWLPKTDEQFQTLSCIQGGSSAATCSEMGFGDANLPLCDLCECRYDIDTLHKLAVDTAGDHVDPRLDEKCICWPYFGNKLKRILLQLKNKAVARETDWKKVAHITRAFLMHNLTISLTEIMLKNADEETFGYIDFIPELLARNRCDPFHNVTDDKEIPKMIDELLHHLMPEGHADELELFDGMTSVEGIRYRRNEREDHRYYGLDYEKDEYVALHYTSRTPHAGEVYGRFVATRKRIVLNPLKSAFIDALIFETSDADYQRLANLGINVGQTITFPTRRIRSERRAMYFDIKEGWPECDHTEGRRVNHTETRYKCSVPAPLCLINQADVITTMNEIGSPIEFI